MDGDEGRQGSDDEVDAAGLDDGANRRVEDSEEHGEAKDGG